MGGFIRGERCRTALYSLLRAMDAPSRATTLHGTDFCTVVVVRVMTRLSSFAEALGGTPEQAPLLLTPHLISLLAC